MNERAHDRMTGLQLSPVIPALLSIWKQFADYKSPGRQLDRRLLLQHGWDELRHLQPDRVDPPAPQDEQADQPDC